MNRAVPDVILSCHGLTACYDSRSAHPAIQGVDIEVGQGEIVGLLGPNGFGKSSTLNAMLGFLRILQGKVYFNGEQISHLGPEAIVGKGMRLFPQGGRVFPDLNVEENLRVACHNSSLDPQAWKGKAFDWFPDLAPRAQTRAGLLSGGQRQILSLAMVLLYTQVGRPSAFLLDEPSGGLDPQNLERLEKVLKEPRDSHRFSILIAEENAVFAKRICERFYQFVEPGQLEAL